MSPADHCCADVTVEEVNAGLADKVDEAADVRDDGEWKPLIVGFCCNWCSYAGADLAGINRFNYPANVRIIRVLCSGRVNPMFVVRALQRGADGVLVAGCHPGDCHYSTGNYFTRRRFHIVKRQLEHIGLEPERVQLHWISAAEGRKFADVVTEMTEQITAIGPNRRLRGGVL
jgi:F420-non-reducing hydrogenase iron-sulfur subunit